MVVYGRNKEGKIGKFLFRVMLIALVAAMICVIMAAASADKKITVIIDPGHGGQDGGAVGITGVYEKDLNLQMSMFLKEYFENAGVKVIMTRTEDADTDGMEGFHKTEDIMNRYYLSQRYPDGIFLSVHMNSSTSSADKGFQVFYGSENETSKDLAQYVYDSVEESALVTRLREVKAAPRTVYLMNHLTSPCILLECGFISNTADSELLTDSAYAKDLAYVLFCGVKGYIDEVVK